MEGFERERNFASSCVRQHGGDAIGEHFACARKIARPFRQSATNHDDALGLDRRGFINHTPVVIDRRVSSGRVGCGE
jgi:hypothetical protein